MTNWTEDERGNRTFEHEGWTVRIWSPENPWNRIEVFPPRSPRMTEEIEVGPEGLWVSGADPQHSYNAAHPITIPWAVVEAIVEARAIVG
jgi:hypothetical protein